MRETRPIGTLGTCFLAAFLGLASLAVWPAREACAAAIELDCLADSADCPELTVAGDPWQEIPGFGPSPFRGYGDPSIRRAPDGDRLWMSYSYLWVAMDAADPTVAEPTVSVHLASSDDGGDTWKLRRRPWPSRAETDPAPPGGAGLSVHEVSTLTPLVSGGSRRWFAARLRYFQPLGAEGRRPGSFHFRLAKSRRPLRLGKAREASLGGPLTDPAWQLDVDLSALDPVLSDCSVWTEPSLFGRGGRLYLVAQCIVIDPSNGQRRPKREFLGVFATGSGRVDRLEWIWLGKLTDRADARALKGHVLTQPEVTTSRDGSLILLVTPKRLTPEERHLGCRALELASLEPPKLGRSNAGKPITRVEIRSSDSTGLGPGLCAYDPDSSTGILFVRTEVDLDLPEVVFRLHATGLHP